MAGPVVYLIHLEGKVAGHAGHYTGETDDLPRRLKSHKRGSGSKLLAEARRLGIAWRLVRTWEAPDDPAARRDLERRIKNAHGVRCCPECAGPVALRRGATKTVKPVVKRPSMRRYGRDLDPRVGTPRRRGEPATFRTPVWLAAASVAELS